MREIRVRRLEKSGEVEMNVPVARVGTNTQDRRGRGGWKKETFKGWRGMVERRSVSLHGFRQTTLHFAPLANTPRNRDVNILSSSIQLE